MICRECERETTVLFAVADYGYETKATKRLKLGRWSWPGSSAEAVEVVLAEELCWVCWQNLPHPAGAKLTSGVWPPRMAPEEESTRLVSRDP